MPDVWLKIILILRLDDAHLKYEKGQEQDRYGSAGKHPRLPVTPNGIQKRDAKSRPQQDTQDQDTQTSGQEEHYKIFAENGERRIGAEPDYRAARAGASRIRGPVKTGIKREQHKQKSHRVGAHVAVHLDVAPCEGIGGRGQEG